MKNKQEQITYVKKVYQIYLSSIVFKNNYSMRFHSANSAIEHLMKAQTFSKVNQTFNITAVNVHSKNQEGTDKMVNLQILTNELPICTILFDVSKQKFTTLQAKSLFRKVFLDKKGYIDYKFIGHSTAIISREQFQQELQKRNQILLKKNEDYLTIKKENQGYVQFMKEKDNLFAYLEDKVQSLMQQNIALNKKINQDFQKLKSPLNINVQIMSRKQRSYSSEPKDNIQKMKRQYQQMKNQHQQLNNKITNLQFDNKKLEQNCKILIDEVKLTNLSKNGQQMVKDLQKRLTEVDNSYLLKKSLSMFDKKFSGKFSLGIAGNQQVIEEQTEYQNQNIQNQIRNSIVLNPKKTSTATIPQNLEVKLKRSITELRSQTQMMRQSSIKVAKGNEGVRISQVKKPSIHVTTVGEKASQKGKNSLVNMQDVEMKEDYDILEGKLQRKQKQIEMLETEISRKQKIIDNLLRAQGEYQKKYQQYQQQKARMLSNMAYSSLGSKGMDAATTSTIKQLSVYNTELVKQKQKLLDQMKQLKQDLNQKNKKIDGFQLTSKKSLLVLSQIAKQKQLYQSKFKEITIGQRISEMKALAEKGMEYETLKTQFIDCQQELSQIKQKLTNLQTAVKQKDVKMQNLTKEYIKMKEEKQNFQLVACKVDGFKRQTMLLQKKYEDIEKLQQSIKSFVIKMQNQIGKKLKKKQDINYEEEMQKLLSTTYKKINTFEDCFYDILLNALKVKAEATERYYAMIVKQQQERPEKQAEVWDQKMDLMKQKEVILSEIKQRQKILNDKKENKVYIIEDQYSNFLQGVKSINERISQLQNFTQWLKDGSSGPAINPKLKKSKSSTLAPPPNNNMLHEPAFGGNMNPLFVNAQAKALAQMKKSGMKKSGMRSSKSSVHQVAIQQRQSDEQNSDDQKSGSMDKSGNYELNQAGTAEFKLRNTMMRESLKEKQTERNTKLSKLKMETEQLRDSMSQNLALKSQMSKEKLKMREREMENMKETSSKVRQLEKGLLMQKNQKERVITKIRQRQMELQRQAQKLRRQNQIKIMQLESEIKKMTENIKQKDISIHDLTETSQKVGTQLFELHQLYEGVVTDKHELQDDNDNMRKMLNDYEQAQKLLIQEVKDIKERQAMAQKEMNQLLEQRSVAFIQIQRIKTQQIQKLTHIIEEMEDKMSYEIEQNLSQKNMIEDYKQQCNEYQNRLGQQKMQFQVYIDNYQNQIRLQKQQKSNLQRQNGQFHKYVIELSNQIQNYEKEILRLNYILQNMEKEKGMWKNLQQQLKNKEENVKEDYLKYTYIIQEKTDKLKKLEMDFTQLSENIKFITRESEFIKEDNNRLKQTIQKVRDDTFKKEREILKIQKQNGMDKLNLQREIMQNQEMQKHIEELMLRIRQLEDNQNNSNKMRTSDKSIKTENRLKAASNDNKLQSSRRDLLVSKNYSKISKDDDSYFQKSGNNIMRISNMTTQQNMNKLTSTNIGKNVRYQQNILNRGSDPLKKTDLLQIKILKPNRMLNLPSVDSEYPFDDDHRNLQPIQQHHDELNDTFFNQPKNNLLDEMSGMKMEYQIAESQRLIPIQINIKQNKADQSCVHIDMMHESVDSIQHRDDHYQEQESQQHHQIQRLESNRSQNRSDRGGITKTNDSAFKQFQNFSTLDLIDEIINLRKILNQNKDKKSQEVSNYLKVKPIQKSIMSSSPPSPTNFRISRKESRDSNKSQQQNKNNQSSNSIHNLQAHNSQLQAQIESYHRQIEDLNKQISSNQIFLHQYEEDKQKLINQLKQKKENVDSLMNQLKTVSQQHLQIASQNLNLKKIIQELKKKNQQDFNNFTFKYQQLIDESFKKDATIFQLEVNIGKEREINNKIRIIVEQKQQLLLNLKKQYKQNQKLYKKNKKEYVKYQEQAEIQILQLREEIDSHKQKIKEKTYELIALGQKYVDLQQTNSSLLLDLREHQLRIEQSQKTADKINSKYQYTVGELENTEKMRKNNVNKIKTVENQNIQLREEVANLHRNMNIELQKYNIRLNAEQQKLVNLKQKLQEKQNVILKLKNQIALYNDQCDQLKKMNDELNRQIVKVQNELEDIMKQYDAELKSLMLQKTGKQKVVEQTNKAIKTRTMEVQMKNRQLRNFDQQNKNMQQQNLQLKSKFDKFKIDSAKQIRELQNQLEFKKDQLQRLQQIKSHLQYQNQFDNTKTDQKNKLYTTTINQLENKIKKNSEKERQLREKVQVLQKRPTQDDLDRANYKSSIFQIKIAQLEHEVLAFNDLKIKKKEQKIMQTYQNEINKLSTLFANQKQKNAKILTELKQVIEAFKCLQDDNRELKMNLDKTKRLFNSSTIVSRQLQRRVNELERQNEQLQKDFRLSKITRVDSYSKIMTDTTIH